MNKKNLTSWVISSIFMAVALGSSLGAGKPLPNGNGHFENENNGDKATVDLNKNGSLCTEGGNTGYSYSISYSVNCEDSGYSDCSGPNPPASVCGSGSSPITFKCCGKTWTLEPAKGNWQSVIDGDNKVKWTVTKASAGTSVDTGLGGIQGV